MHSQIPMEDQLGVFQAPPPGSGCWALKLRNKFYFILFFWGFLFLFFFFVFLWGFWYFGSWVLWYFACEASATSSWPPTWQRAH